MTDRLRFDAARSAVLGEGYSDSGIGTLSERSLHRILKLYYEPDDRYHEIKVLGAVADIMNGDGITEIQTRAFSRLVPKLRRFLQEYPVTVVYPLESSLHFRTIDRESGEMSERKRSTKKCTVFSAVYELYNIRELLSSPNMSVKLVFMDIDEFRYNGGTVIGKARRRERIERIPNAITQEITLRDKDDYRIFIPPGLPQRFTAADFNRAVGKRYRYGYSAIQILRSLGIIGVIEKIGRKTYYEII